MSLFLMFFSGDHMVNAGDMGREMYVIRRGYAEALVPDCSSVLATLTPGTYFGEVKMYLLLCLSVL